MKDCLFKYILAIILLFAITSCDAFSSDVTPPPNVANVSPTLNPQEAIESEKGSAMDGNTNKEQIVSSVQVEGVIKNVANKALPNNLLVTLHGYYQGREVYSKTVPCDPKDLSFSFKDVVSHIGWYFFTSIQLDNVVYYSDVIKVQQDDTRLVLPIPIYEVSDDISLLEMDKLYILMKINEPDFIQVMQMVSISNKSSKMVASTNPNQAGTLPFYLPKQAERIEFVDGSLGERYIKTDYGFIDTIPIIPGQNTYQNMIAFTLPYKQKIEYVQLLPLKVHELMVFIPIEQDNQPIKVKAENLNYYDKQNIDGIEYQIYKGGEFKPQDKLQFIIIFSSPAFSLKNWITSIVQITNVDYRMLLGLFFFGIAVIAVGFWMLQVEKSKNHTLNHINNDEWFNDPETVIEAIIALDENFKTGKLSEETYTKQRNKLKSLLAKQLENYPI